MNLALDVTQDTDTAVASARLEVIPVAVGRTQLELLLAEPLFAVEHKTSEITT